jgi:hypothetical protein
MPYGSKLWEETSRALGRRIREVDDRGRIHEEVSWRGQIRGFGRLDGHTGSTVGTDDYWETVTGENIIEGSAHGVLNFGEGRMVGFRAHGRGKFVHHSPLAFEDLVLLISFPDPPAELAWMKTTVVVWEARVDPRNQTIEATAYEWRGPSEPDQSAPTP